MNKDAKLVRPGTARRRPVPRKGPRAPAYRGHITLEGPLGLVLSESRIRLLEAIEQHGSLLQAAKAVPLSYKAAWDALNAINALAETPVVLRSKGGSGGGGSLLTPYGRHVVALYRAMESSQQDILDRLDSPPSEDDIGALKTQIKRLTMRSSARNQWRGTVCGVLDRGGLVEVSLELGRAPDGRPEVIRSTITPESARAMALALGAEVYALVKAPGIDVAASPPRSTAGLNVLTGEVIGLHVGAVGTGVEIRLPSGLAVHAVVDPRQAQGLAPGRNACALFPGDQVVLVSFF